MAEAHVVQELCFEVDFATSEQAWEGHERVIAFANGAALRILDEAFAEAAPAGEVLRLESLVLDLGEVAPDDLESQWAQRLLEALHRGLADARERHLTGAAAGDTAPVQRLSTEAAEREALLHFLQHGRLPWHHPDVEPAALAARVRPGHDEALLQQLCVLAMPPGAGRLLAARLARQFPADWLAQLERALLLAAQPAATVPGPWPQRAVDAEQRLLGALIAGRVAPSPLQAMSLRQPATGGPGREPVAGPVADLRRFRALLVDDAPVLSGQDLQSLLELWQRLVHSDPAGLRQCLLVHGRSARVRRRVARLWPEAVLSSIATLWPAQEGAPDAPRLPPPAHADVVARRRGWEDWLRHRLVGDRGGPSPHDPGRLAAWEATASPERLRAWIEPLAAVTDSGRPTEVRRALRTVAAHWSQQRVLAASASRADLATLLGGWMPRDEALAISGLAFAALPPQAVVVTGRGNGPGPAGAQLAATEALAGAAPPAGETPVDGPPADAARRAQWLLQVLVATPEEHHWTLAALVRAGMNALAVHQGRSPAELAAAWVGPQAGAVLPGMPDAGTTAAGLARIGPQAPASQGGSAPAAWAAAIEGRLSDPVAAALPGAPYAPGAATSGSTPTSTRGAVPAPVMPSSDVQPAGEPGSPPGRTGEASPGEGLDDETAATLARRLPQPLGGDAGAPLRLALVALGGPRDRLAADWARCRRDDPAAFSCWLRGCLDDPARRRRLALRLLHALRAQAAAEAVAEPPDRVDRGTATVDAPATAVPRPRPTPAVGSPRAALAQRQAARALARAWDHALLPSPEDPQPSSSRAPEAVATAWDAAWPALRAAAAAGDLAQARLQWSRLHAADPDRLRLALRAHGPDSAEPWRLAALGDSAWWCAWLVSLAPAGSVLGRRMARGVALQAETAAGERPDANAGVAATPRVGSAASVASLRLRWLSWVLEAPAARPAVRHDPWGKAATVALALQHGRPLAPSWQALLLADAGTLREALPLLAQDTAVRQRLAAALTPAMRDALLARLLPATRRRHVAALIDLLATESAALRSPLHATLLSLLAWNAGATGRAWTEHLLEQAAWRLGLSVPALARHVQAEATRLAVPGLDGAGLSAWASEPAALRIPPPAGAPADAADADLPWLLHWLRGAAPPKGQAMTDSEAAPAAMHTLALLYGEPGHPAREVLRAAIEEPLAARRLAQALPASGLLDLLAWLRPADAASLRQAWPALQALGERAAAAGGWPVVARAVLRELVEQDRPLHVPGLLQRAADALQDGPPLPRPAEPTQGLRADAAPDGPLFVDNAGLVLLAPYVPRLFAMLGLTREQAFTDGAAAERAVLLLQYLVTGRAAAPEHRLPLNKLMCGLPLHAPVAADAALEASEREAADGLLTAVIAHWSALGRTSPAGLRQTFLQRQARLDHEGEAWHLYVPQQTFDMLLDRLPWGYGTLRFPWMPEVLHVQWR